MIESIPSLILFSEYVKDHRVVEDLSGREFGRYSVSNKVIKIKGALKWECACKCGTVKLVGHYHLLRGATKSCGCLRDEGASERGRKAIKHGLCYSSTYRSWRAMKNRCLRSKNHNYSLYGGRGISVSPAWMDFSVFLGDMGLRPEGSTLERINNNGNYEPGNCRWATSKEQSNNRSVTTFLTIDGEKLAAADWSRRTGIKMTTIHRRLGRGLPHKDVLSKKGLRSYGNLRCKTH
jgi:hypothetical protein